MAENIEAGDYVLVRLPVVNRPDEYGQPRVQIRTMHSSTGIRVSRSNIVRVEKAKSVGPAPR